MTHGPPYTESVLTWLDVLALFSAAAATAVGVRKGVSFFFVFPLALGLFAFAIFGLHLAPMFWPVAGLLSGLIAAYLAGRWYVYLSEFWDGLLGGIAGFVWGMLLAISLWVGLPADYSLATGAYRYPSPDLPLVVQEAVVKSPFALPLFKRMQQLPLAREFFIEARVVPPDVQASPPAP